MKDISKEVLHVIRESIKLEINGKKFFDHAVGVTKSELGKKMFTKLAQDELEHLKIFKELFSSAIGGDDWQEFIKEEEVKAKSPLIEELAAETDKEERAIDLDALRIGMKLEKKAIDFFEKSADGVSDPTAKEIFKKISEEEKLHYDLLQAQYDYLTKSGYWFDIAEYKMDGQF